ncbi:hypothetical protein [Chromobacterium haemolyticum]|uniref:hypothetical protein n=1 Tax=Chromobacterium TaxID=535 RepID=UPI004056834A
MPNIIAYTLARKVPIYKDITNGKLISFIPEKSLNSMTKVELIYETALIHFGIPYIWARVIEGNDIGVTGYIPRFGVHTCYIQQIPGSHNVDFTGVKYGSYSRSSDASIAKEKSDIYSIGIKDNSTIKISDYKKMSERDINKTSFVNLEMAKKMCPYCLGQNSDHKILETATARSVALKVHSHLRQNQCGQSFMIGVLEHYSNSKKPSLYCSISKSGEDTTRIQNLTRVFCKANEIKYVTADKIEQKLQNLNGDEIKNEHFTSESILQCAAPKLIQYITQRKLYNTNDNIYLSEIWYQQANSHNLHNDTGSIDSCNRCRIIIPRMLCGFKNPYSKEKIGRPKNWVTLDKFLKGGY